MKQEPILLQENLCLTFLWLDNFLLSGHHKNIEEWRYEQSMQRTQERRPDLYEIYVEAHREELEKRRRKKEEKERKRLRREQRAKKQTNE